MFSCKNYKFLSVCISVAKCRSSADFPYDVSKINNVRVSECLCDEMEFAIPQTVVLRQTTCVSPSSII